jgi:hypothetical protein
MSKVPTWIVHAVDLRLTSFCLCFSQQAAGSRHLAKKYQFACPIRSVKLVKWLSKQAVMSNMYLMFGPAYVSESESGQMYHGYISYRRIPYRKLTLLRDGLEQMAQLICSQMTVSNHEQC